MRTLDDYDPATDATTVFCQIGSYRIDELKIKALARFICRELGVPSHELSISLVGSDEIQQLNQEFRGLDRPTDVLSFPQLTFDPPLTTAKATQHSATKRKKDAPPDILGDVVISLPEAELNARGIGQELDREVCFLLVHGILHLCGHDHEEPDEEQRMLAEQRIIMSRLGEAEGGPLWRGSAGQQTP